MTEKKGNEEKGKTIAAVGNDSKSVDTSKAQNAATASMATSSLPLPPAQHDFKASVPVNAKVVSSTAAASSAITQHSKQVDSKSSPLSYDNSTSKANSSPILGSRRLTRTVGDNAAALPKFVTPTSPQSAPVNVPLSMNPHSFQNSKSHTPPKAINNPALTASVTAAVRS